MPSPQKLPDPTGWRFVLVHRVVRHGATMLIPGYIETARSFLSLHHGEVKPTVVLRTKELRDRALRLGGWMDITDEVGPQTPKLWDEERGRWRLDPEGFLPWERTPGEKAAPIPVQEEEDLEDPEEVEEVPLLPPQERPAASPSPEKPEPPPAQEKPLPAPAPTPSSQPTQKPPADAPAEGKGPKKPTTRPRG